MNDQDERPPVHRGEAAWKEAKERIAERNEAARKAGKLEREAYENERSKARRAAERRRMGEVLKD